MIQSKGYAAQNAASNLAPWEFQRRDLTQNDVLIDILYCGGMPLGSSLYKK
ncbi:hypothetical protein [Flavobacterium sp. MDT1-60]|uniref:hypothetical protein n=1 Tax=Flavobacterium sp. MDT1-60 TaxID=1979344 RepID=UPI001785511F|nr:hypothetical protein [Flavobacterium sp. MDT1-60]QOG00802.1 hypothetical protein IHE43_13325 [Flavobacterium sp. MDT1-60]